MPMAADSHLCVAFESWEEGIRGGAAHKGMSVVMSPPGAVSRGRTHPGSSTSRSGHALGLRRQKRRKSKAFDCGTATKLACTKPAACPLVGPPCDPCLTLSLRAPCRQPMLLLYTHHPSRPFPLSPPLLVQFNQSGVQSMAGGHGHRRRRAIYLNFSAALRSTPTLSLKLVPYPVLRAMPSMFSRRRAWGQRKDSRSSSLSSPKFRDLVSFCGP